MSAQDDIASAPESGQVADIPKPEDGFRVYVGNLSFSTTEEQVREFVSQASSDIASLTLPMRFGRRPAGYAFVSYKKEEDAKKVVAELNDKELGDRKLRLEIAKPADEVLAQRQARDEKRKESRAAAKATKAEASAAKGEEAGATTEGEAKDGENKPKRKKSKAKKPRRRLPEEGEETEGAGETSETAAPKASKPRKTTSEARIDVNGAGAEGEKKERAPRPKRERKPRLQLSGEESKNTIFVANLPFSVDDDALAAIFTNLSIKVKTATVVKGVRKARDGSSRPFRASKGFGFVEIEDESQQAEAVSKVEGTLIGDRAITAKVAKEMKPVEAEEVKEAAAAEAEAPTA